MTGQLERAYIGIGSNLGEPEFRCREAAERLAFLPRSRLAGLSSLYRTQPVGPVRQDPFVNAVAGLDTELSPRELMSELLALERAMGRERRIRWGPRVVDLDLLFYGSLVQEEPGLTLPHPRLHERRFVLAPLGEIAPDLRHPRLGLTVRELLDALEDPSWVEPLGPLGPLGPPPGAPP